MNKEEFLTRLEDMLQDIAISEREEVLQYYRDYFEDAGNENEQSVIQALGDPAAIAANIKRDLQGDETVRGKFSAHAVVEYGSPTTGDSNPYYDNLKTNTDWNRGDTEQSVREKKEMPGWAIVLLVILLVFASPVLLGLMGALFGVMVSWFAIIFSFGVTAFVLFAVLFVLMIVGIICVATDPLVGMAVIGGGLICGGIAMLFLMLTVAMAGILTPAIFRGIRWLFGSKKKEKTV